jgi:hypothetical protein
VQILEDEDEENERYDYAYADKGYRNGRYKEEYVRMDECLPVGIILHMLRRGNMGLITEREEASS